jgi:hypothetical protein
MWQLEKEEDNDLHTPLSSSFSGRRKKSIFSRKANFFFF